MGPRRAKNEGTIQDAKHWMQQQLDHGLATGSDLVCFGAHDVRTAAESGAVAVLLIHSDECGSHMHETVWTHGGQIVRASHDPNVEGLGMAALLRFSFHMVEPTHEETVFVAEGNNESSQPQLDDAALPMAQRSLTFFAPAGAPVEPTESVPAMSAELELLSAMFSEERKMRMLEPYDGSHFLLHVDATSDTSNGYLILEVIVPQAYPEEALPLTTVPFGQLGDGRVLSHEETTAAAASCCASVTVENLGEPMMFCIYEAAREWLRAEADSAGE